MDNQRQRYYFIVMYSTTVTEVTETCFAVATFLCEKSSEEPVRVARVKKKNYIVKAIHSFVVGR